MTPSRQPKDPLYSYVEGFVSELAAQQVVWAFISPGSRSTPLALAAHRSPLEGRVILDERSAGFVALGAARATRQPSILICTSGTAVANYLPAVAEASLTNVPLVILSADRPVELRGWSPGQTIDQVGIFGSHVRWQTEVPIPTGGPASPLDGDVGPEHARRLALRAVATARGPRPGPVHLNWPFRMPLEPPDDWFATAPARTP